MSIATLEFADQLNKEAFNERKLSEYVPTEAELKIRNRIVKHFNKGYQVMTKPRVELDDLNLISRMNLDKKSTNTYLRNAGELGGEDWWRSTATKPVIRSKVQQIASYAVSQLLFPKVFSRDKNNNEQELGATVMTNLMEYVGEQVGYKMLMLEMVYNALSSPVVYAYKDYQFAKRMDKDGKMVDDEYLSGHIGRCIPGDQIFFPNINERNIQLQDFIIWRNVISHDMASVKYGDEEKYPNFAYVKPGVMAVLNDANQLIYTVYDSELQKDEVEDVLYWNRKKCEFHILVNGILLTPKDSKNKREDGRYPFEPMGYSLISSNFAYYKSLAHAEFPTSKTLNEMWRMLNDASFLSSFPPMIAVGGENITNQVITPGGVTTFRDPTSDLRPITLASNLKASVNAVQLLEESVEKIAPTPMGEKMSGNATAYAVAKQDQAAQTQLGLFYMMIADFVLRYGRLMMSDILQYETLGAVKSTSGEIGYKSYLFQDKKSDTGKNISQKFSFDPSMPSDEMTEDKAMELSTKIMMEEDEDTEIMKANPKLFRTAEYDLVITPDQLKQPSEEFMRYQNLEIYDRAINNPMVKVSEVTKDFLFRSYPNSRDVDRYVKSEEDVKKEQQAQQPQPSPMPTPQPGMPQAMPQ